MKVIVKYARRDSDTKLKYRIKVLVVANATRLVDTFGEALVDMADGERIVQISEAGFH
jgi:hypothetical protein